MKNNIAAKLKKMILFNAKNKNLISKITNSSNLINDFGYDSIQMLNLLINIENNFGIEFEDEDLYTNLLINYGSLLGCIEKKIL